MNKDLLANIVAYLREYTNPALDLFFCYMQNMILPTKVWVNMEIQVFNEFFLLNLIIWLNHFLAFEGGEKKIVLSIFKESLLAISQLETNFKLFQD